MTIPNTLTVKEMAIMGMELKLVPKGTPQPDGELRSDLDEYFGKKHKEGKV